MPPESNRPTTAKPHHTAACATGAPPPEPEHLPCPRCDSTNTKFCYYNNYNFSQPRHFCKSCRRYWTHGGTLRDIPVGGGSRKNAKRSRLTTATATEFRHMPPPSAAPVLFPFAGDHVSPAVSSFTSLLNGNQSHGLFGIGFEDATFGFGRTIWPFSGAGDGGHYGGGATGGGGLWQVDGGDGGGECFTLPELAISTPGMM